MGSLVLGPRHSVQGRWGTSDRLAEVIIESFLRHRNNATSIDCGGGSAPRLPLRKMLRLPYLFASRRRRHFTRLRVYLVPLTRPADEPE